MSENETKNNKVICVLGMHRSGTSMMMRLLNICGVYIGEENELIPASKSNEAGHWEHKKILEINKEILKRFGGSDLKLPALPDHWEKNPLINDLRLKGLSLVGNLNSQKKIWGFKDPRTCLTLPFWKKIIPNMIYIIPIRNPEEVALSLKKRNKTSITAGLLLWTQYWVNIIKNIEDESKFFTVYDNYFENWQNELKKVLTFINIPEINFADKEWEIENFINLSLKHNKSNRMSDLVLNRDYINLDKNILLKSFFKEFNYNLNVIQKNLEELEESNKINQQIIQKQTGYIQDILNSTSWKITTPLRFIKDACVILKNKIFSEKNRSFCQKMINKVKKLILRKKHILFIIPWLEIGGSEEVLHHLIQGINKKFFISIMTTDKSTNPWRRKFLALTKNIYFLPDILDESDWFPYITSFIYENDIDIVQISNSELGYKFTPRLKKTFPLLKIVDLLHVANSKGDYFQFSLPFSQYIDRRITVSKFNKNLLLRQGIDEEKIEIIYNGIDTNEKFNPEIYKLDKDQYKKLLSIPRDKKIITFIGRLSEQKQPLQFVEIAKTCLEKPLKNLHFIIIGDGPLKQKVLKLINHYRLENYFSWLEMRDDIPQILLISDMVIMPSREEGFPIVGLEVMAMRVPLVATNITGLNELIEHEKDGFLVEFNAAEEYVRKIKFILENSDKMNSITENARQKIINNYNTQQMVNKYIYLYKNLLKK